MVTRSEEPVFVFVYYVSRSGSTFLLNELSKIKGVITCPEGEILEDIFLKRKKIKSAISRNQWKRISANLSENEKMKIWKIDLEKLGRQIIGQNSLDAFFLVLREYSQVEIIPCNYIVFKSTSLLNQNSLNELAGNRKVKIISLIRDCRGVYASQKKFRLYPSGHKMANNPITVSFNWKKHFRNSTKYNRSDFFSIFLYEDLIYTLEATIKRIHEFIGIDVKASDILPKGNQISKIPTEQIQFHGKINSPPNYESIYLWQKELSNQEIGLIELINKKELINLGYCLKSNIATINATSIVFLLRHLKYLLKKFLLKLYEFEN